MVYAYSPHSWGFVLIFYKVYFILRVLAKPTLLFMQIILYCMTILYCMAIINLKGKLHRTCWRLSVCHQRALSTITCTHLVIYSLSKYALQALLRIVSTVMMITKLYYLNSVFVAFIHCPQLAPASQHTVQWHEFLLIWTCFFCLWPTRITSHAWIIRISHLSSNFESQNYNPVIITI